MRPDDLAVSAEVHAYDGALYVVLLMLVIVLALAGLATFDAAGQFPVSVFRPPA
jgi:hypothetical protein